MRSAKRVPDVRLPRVWSFGLDAVRAACMKHVERWAASGLSAKEFAAQSGTNWRSLSWWKWRIRRRRAKDGRRSEHRGRSRRHSPLLSFVEVTASLVRDPLGIVLPPALRVWVPAGFDDATLARFLDVLARRR